MSDALGDVRAQFPGFRIWQERIGDRTRYVARSMRRERGPHTVVTADLDEMRALLADAPARPQPAGSQPSGAGTPSIAGMYSHWLRGKDNFEADRITADAIRGEFPQVSQVARANRDFVIRAVRHVAAQGITQYLDIGAGLPISPAVHEIAQQAEQAARVAYIDNDPVVVGHVHARTLLAGPGVMAATGDVRQATDILACSGPLGLIDLGEPVCVILAAVLHFVTPHEADATVAALIKAIAPGSYLVLSAGTSTGTDPAMVDRLQAAYAGAAVITSRTESEIAAYFTGLRLEPPGLTDVWAWRPDSGRYWPPANARILGAVGRKPAVAVVSVGTGESAADIAAERAALEKASIGRPA